MTVDSLLSTETSYLLFDPRGQDNSSQDRGDRHMDARLNYAELVKKVLQDYVNYYSEDGELA